MSKLYLLRETTLIGYKKKEVYDVYRQREDKLHLSDWLASFADKRMAYEFVLVRRKMKNDILNPNYLILGDSIPEIEYGLRLQKKISDRITYQGNDTFIRTSITEYVKDMLNEESIPELSSKKVFCNEINNPPVLIEYSQLQFDVVLVPKIGGEAYGFRTLLQPNFPPTFTFLGWKNDRKSADDLD